MDFDVLFDKIGLWEAGRTSFWNIHSRCNDADFLARFEKSLEEFREGDAAFGEYIREFAAAENVPPQVMILYVYVRLSEQTLAEYRKRGMPDDVFYESMRDLEVDSRYNYEKTGIYGISETPHRSWIRRHLENKMYRFGRLQFEPYTMQFDAEVDGVSIRKGDLCFSTHIPRYEPFEEAACEESYARAREFFREYYATETCVFLCSSWLIHPWLGECLNENSRIVRFQRKYKVLKTTHNPDSLIRTAFPEKKENIDDYPEDTSLQRAVKERLKNGLPMGTAVGIRL